MTDIFYNRTTSEDILAHFVECQIYVRERSLDSYAQKIRMNAITVEIWNTDILIALCACYMNDFETKTAYVTHIAVSPVYREKGYGKKVLKNTIALAQKDGFERIDLEVVKTNVAALNLYKLYHFKVIEERDDKYLMSLRLTGKESA